MVCYAIEQIAPASSAYKESLARYSIESHRCYSGDSLHRWGEARRDWLLSSLQALLLSADIRMEILKFKNSQPWW